MTEHADADPASPATKRVEYTYDWLNHRVCKAVDPDGDGGGTVEEYRYDIYQGDTLLMEMVDPDGLGDPTNPPTIAHRYLWGPAVDQILAVEDPAVEVLWGLADHQGTIRDIVNSTGTVVDHRQYNSFGKLTSNPAVDFIFGYTGKPLDSDTGLQYNHNRWYDATVGRWLNEDFIPDDTNPYRYVRNGPMTGVDPNGLETINSENGAVYWTVEQDGYLRDWDVRSVLIGTVQPDETVKIYDHLGGGIVTQEELEQAASDFWNGFPDISDCLPEVQNQYIQDALGRITSGIGMESDQCTDGFWDSIGSSLVSIGLTYKGIWQQVTGDPDYLSTYLDAYEGGPLGQTQDSSGIYYYGTRGALVVSTGATAGAIFAGVWGALGGGQFAIGVSSGPGWLPHVTYGWGTGGSYVFGHGLGSGLFTTTVGASAPTYILTGIPIVSPVAVGAWVATRPTVGNCFCSVCHAFLHGWGF